MNEATRCCADFSGLLRGHLLKLEGFSTRRRYERNQIVYSVDDLADAVYLVESGRIKVQLASAAGREKIIGISHAGEIFGELCICGIVRRAEEAVALEPARVSRFGVDGLLRLFPHEQELAKSFFQLVCGRVLECQEQVAALAFDPTPRRLARELLRLSELPDCRRENGTIRLGSCLTHEELAALVGTSRGVITTVLNQFRERGLVDYGSRNMSVFPERVKAYLDESG